MKNEFDNLFETLANAMKPNNEYYDICQGKTYNGKWVTPKFPLTDAGMMTMLFTGVAKALGHENIQYTASWGHGIYVRNGNDDYTCISSNWDSSG